MGEKTVNVKTLKKWKHYTYCFTSQIRNMHFRQRGMWCAHEAWVNLYEHTADKNALGCPHASLWCALCVDAN